MGKLPLDEATFKATLSPGTMVRTRVGIGGPQPSEVRCLIAMARDALTQDRARVAERNNTVLEAEAQLNSAFAKHLAS